MGINWIVNDDSLPEGDSAYMALVSDVFTQSRILTSWPADRP
jgi:hypothetical protein